MEFNTADAKYMDQALALAKKAWGQTSPNPMVGAVVVKEGEVVGEGFHPAAGASHAEVLALNAAGQRAAGADLYVTLEPCCHRGRTGPCTDVILAAGVKRVIVATLDPNPLVAGQGVKKLRQAGVTVEVGLKEEEARRLNEAFFTFITKGRPFVTAKWAMTMDGKIACVGGTGSPISGPVAHRCVHELRHRVDAIMVGVGTVLADNPLLTARRFGKPTSKDPIRVILDSNLRTPPTARLLHSGSSAPTWIACLESAARGPSPLKEFPGVELLPLPEKAGHLDLQALFQLLGTRQITHVLLEGGSTVNYAALQEGVIDKIICIVAPKLVGGAAAPTPMGGQGQREMSAAWPAKIHRTYMLGGDVVIEAYLDSKDSKGENPCLPD